MDHAKKDTSRQNRTPQSGQTGQRTGSRIIVEASRRANKLEVFLVGWLVSWWLGD